MDKVHVIDYLRTHTFGELEAEHGVSASVSRSKPWKFSLNYSQIDSKPGPLVNQCRGLILRTHGAELPVDSKELAAICPGSVSVIARPFDRFFNHGDPHAAEVDWNDSKLAVLEKLDGTLAIVYHDCGNWHMATRSVPDADLPFDSYGKKMTFRELFDLGLRETTGLHDLSELMWEVNEDLTFCFELTSPYNQIVVKYDVPEITWIGTRHRNGRELTYEETIAALPADLPKYFPLAVEAWRVRTISDIQSALEKSAATELEGVVVIDSQFRRLKIKSLAWLAANKIKSAAGSIRGMTQLILMGKEDDVISLIPPDAVTKIDEIRTAISELCRTLDRTHEDFKARASGNRKEYALLVNSSGLWSSPLFGMYQKSIGARRWIDDRRDAEGYWPNGFIDTLLEQAGIHDEAS